MKKSIVILLGSTILLTLASISNTIAWYMSASEAAVEQFDLYLETDQQLKISSTGEIDDFHQELKLNYEDEDEETKHYNVFIPVSSMFSSLWIEERANEPIFRGPYNPTADVNGVPYLHNAIKNKGYYSHEFYLTCDEDHYVTIDPDVLKTNFLANLEYNKQSAKKHYTQYPYISSPEEMEERLNNIINSLRISILYKDDSNYDYWIIDPYKEEETIMAGPLDANFTASSLDEDTVSGYYNYYLDTKINDYKEICFGEIFNREKLIYKSSPEQDDSELIGTPSTFNARHKKGVIALDWEASLENMTLGEDVGVEPSLTLEEASNKVLIPVFANTSSKIIVSFYLEGWDKDSINETMDAGFEINMAFMIAPVAPPIKDNKE